MNLINNNPFRILDVPITASAREITKQINKLETYAEMGKTKSYDSDFSFLAPINRTTQSIDDAKKQIERSESKFHYSLFWFWINNSRNELAYEHLKAGNLNKAIEVWEAACKIEYLDISYCKNLSTLYLSLAINNRSFHKDYFIKGIKLAETFFTSKNLENYSKLIAGDNYIYDSKKALHFYLNDLIDSVKKYIEQEGGISTSQLYELFSSFPIEAKQFLNTKLILKQTQNINIEIENSISVRKKTPLQGIEVGKKLIDNTKSDLTYLKNILGADDFQYQILADKLSLEIIQCGIDSFNANKNEQGEIDYPKATKSEESYITEYEYALSIASTPATKARANENLNSCKEFIANKYLHNCWFCETILPENKSQFSKRIYKVNYRHNSYPKRSVNYSTLDIKINRCVKCKKLHFKTTLIHYSILTIMTLIGYGIGQIGINMGEFNDNIWLIFSLFGFGIGYAISNIFIIKALTEEGVKSIRRSSIKKFPVIAEKIEDGWSFNKPSA